MRDKNKTNVVMVADDDVFVRKIVRNVVSEFAEVVEVADGTGVVEAYRIHTPDIMFLDIHMPGMSGVEVMKHIKSMDPDSYVVMLSSDSSATNVLTTKQLGTKGFITKPFQQDRIIACLGNCPTIKFMD